jgi:methylenetetrahydrofolate dehydrogenase (NADP+) / methenyltetrahydrofolate cyclohydrolase
MILLNGQKIADKILDNLKKEIKDRRLKLKLAVVLIGQDAASLTFIKKKQQAAKKIGVGFSFYKFSEQILAEELKQEIKKIVDDPEVSGVVIQLPLPKNIDTAEILNLVPLKKDPDVLATVSFEKFKLGDLDILPPTVGAINYLLKEYQIDLRGKNIVLVGAGRLVGKPLAAWFGLQGVDFSILDKTTVDIQSFTQKADILISGVGKHSLIKGEMIKEGAIVFDAGTTKENGKTVGDIDFKSVAEKAGYVTPVLGGIGPLTVACLLENLVKLQK